jgi:hypothetical protein
MPQTSLHQVPDHSRAYSLAYDETRTRRGETPGGVRVEVGPSAVGSPCGLRTPAEVHDEQGFAGTASAFHRGCEVLAPPQPILGGQHSMTPVADQADRRVRPLPRRVARIARPARVRIRSRKPWVFARRRLFGWKVRLLTRGLQGQS